MRYRSTRASKDADLQTFCDILLGGLAPDGGLYMPVSYPQISQYLPKWRQVLTDEGYSALAFEVLRLFIDDIAPTDLRAICDRAYNYPKFSDPNIVSAEQIGTGRIWVGHISNGPTAAFKDMAMQLLGELFEYELARRNSKLTIVGATSGDTGSSAEYALRGRPGIKVVMLTPAGRMTPFQRAQMYTLDDENIVNIALDGVFDDCQDLVKALNLDAEFKAKYAIGAVNSINWARLAAQVVYYVALWLKVSQSDDEVVNFAVPSGNFGNICAGHIARQMGLPIGRLILATNENDVLDEFFHTGNYRVRPSDEVLATSSPSMDISKASNFERFIFDLLDHDAARVADLFGRQIPEQGRFTLAHTPEFDQAASRFGFLSGASDHQLRIITIAGLYKSLGILVDPHTADGIHVATDMLGEVEGKIIALETALPVKFADTIFEATETYPQVPERFRGIEDKPAHAIELPNDLEALKAIIISAYNKA